MRCAGRNCSCKIDEKPGVTRDIGDNDTKSVRCNDFADFLFDAGYILIGDFQSCAWGRFQVD